MSAAASIRGALAGVDGPARIIGSPDDLSFGPIDPPSPELRQKWASINLPCDYEEVVSAAELFWAEATALDATPVAWVCTTDAQEHAGFLEFVWRMAGRPFDLVDATGIEGPASPGQDGPSRPWSLGVMRSQDIVASRLVDRKSACTPERADKARTTWLKLRKDNAPFRIVKSGHLVSAPLEYYDVFLEKHSVKDWQKAARLIGETMGYLEIGLDPRGQSPSDMVLFGRMLALGEAGVLDVEGSGPEMRDYRVRRPSTMPMA